MSARRYANPAQSAPDLGPKFHDGLGICCGDTATVCAYDFVTSDGAAITAASSITFVGNSGADVTVALTGAINAPTIRRKIAAALRANLIDPDYYDGLTTVTVLGNTVRILSYVEIKSLTLNTVARTAVKKCVPAGELVYVICLPFDEVPGDLSDGTTSVAINASAYTSSTAASAVVTDVTTALGGLDVEVVGIVKAVKDTVGEQFKVAFRLVQPEGGLYFRGTAANPESPSLQGWVA